MQIKRFEAKDMTAALRLIKKELGPEAVILSARSLKVENKIWGSIRTSGVEVTAAIDTYDLPGRSNLDSYVYNRPTGNHRGQFTAARKKKFVPAVQNKIKSRVQRRRPLDAVNDQHRRHEDVPDGIFQHLLSQGVKRNVAKDIVEAIKKEFQANGSELKDKIIPMITEVLEEKRATPRQRSRAQSGPKVLAFIGPTGVGKTTSIAKLAARQVIQHNKKVALITVDSYRIAAAEELKVYGKAIGIPVKTAASTTAFKAVINEYGHYDLILIDTPGINAENPREIDDLKSYLEAIQSVETHLLLSAGAKETDLFNTIQRLSKVNVQYLIFTKLDESTTFGNLINLLVRNQLPLSFLTTGRQVPDSIVAGSVEEIVKCLLANYRHDLQFSNSGTPHQVPLNFSNAGAGDGFVANKNSDVFHCPDCKWTQKIKSKNMITFASVQEAKLRQFVPCRDCRPASKDTFQNEFPRKERMRISSYS
ncbi:MAG: flagellar biosynthesis protein FlhF [Desulfobacterales bacterium]|jgi:flagellar biosynthesis protein FlhF